MEKKKKKISILPPVKTETFPMRINKYLAWKNYETRRGADVLIASGIVFLNGKKAILGDIVHEKDVVEVRQIRPPKERLYYAYYKPKGIITHSPQEEEISIAEAIGRKDVFPVGRIDKDSHGLIILTNDGRITERLLSPSMDHEKEYIVQTNEKLKSNLAARMGSGVNIEGYQTKPCIVKALNPYQFSIILTEGKKHQIRRMCAALGYTVADLKRTRIMNVRLQALKPGAYRLLEGTELDRFLKALNLR
jgi:23S rRNA pseudouridine2604 synthase